MDFKKHQRELDKKRGSLWEYTNLKPPVDERKLAKRYVAKIVVLISLGIFFLLLPVLWPAMKYDVAAYIAGVVLAVVAIVMSINK